MTPEEIMRLRATARNSSVEETTAQVYTSDGWGGQRVQTIRAESNLESRSVGTWPSSPVDGLLEGLSLVALGAFTSSLVGVWLKLIGVLIACVIGIVIYAFTIGISLTPGKPANQALILTARLLLISVGFVLGTWRVWGLLF